MKHLSAASDEARGALLEMRAGVPGIAVSTFVIGLFPVALTLYLLLVFDVALPGHSVATLFGITAIFLAFIGFHAFIGLLRRRMLGQIGDIAAAHLMPRLDDATARMGEGRSTRVGDGLQISRDLDAIQHFLKSSAAVAWLDIAALPVLLITAIFLGIGQVLVILVAAAAMLFLLVRAVRSQEQPARDMVALMGSRHAVSETSRANPETIRALGMRNKAMQAWALANDRLARALSGSRERMRRDVVTARALRFAGFALLLLVGGLQAIDDHASPAAVMAGAMLGWFALSPIVGAVEHADLMVAARQGWARLDTALRTVPVDAPTLELPEPAATLLCEGAAIVVPGVKRPLVQGISFDLKAGDIMTVVGPGGVGKSAVLRGLSGAWPLAAGKVRLDGAALDQWDSEKLGRHIGYMPQTIDMIEGTVAQNIARFDPDPDPQAVVNAAHAAMIHEMIVRLPDGYNTHIGPNGNRLSVSQAQRIALARALYGEPFVVILDEPTAHLDGRSEKSVAAAVAAASARGAIVILGGVAASIVEMATHVLVMKEGGMVDFGEKGVVRQRLMARHSGGANAGGEPQDNRGGRGNNALKAESETEAEAETETQA